MFLTPDSNRPWRATAEIEKMSSITLRFSGDCDSYGDDATRADMDALNEIMAEYLESLGHTVEIGPDTDHASSEHTWDGEDDEELRAMTNAAWDHACATYIPTE